jgi:hypothetical protein
MAETFVDKQHRAIQSDAEGKCGCWRCLEERDEVRYKMILCPLCGCKRCPKASNHDLACTESNEPGQSGSVYKSHPSLSGRET